MSDTHPTPKMKPTIVKEAWAGHKITQIARKYRVCRDSIYTWMHIATQACLHALSLKKRGPKFKKLVDKDKIISSLEYAKLLRPDRCPCCGRTRILLNGYYPISK